MNKYIYRFHLKAIISIVKNMKCPDIFILFGFPKFRYAVSDEDSSFTLASLGLELQQLGMRQC